MGLLFNSDPSLHGTLFRLLATSPPLFSLRLRGMPQSLDPDQLIEQGARDEGYKPSHAEVPLAAATFSLREAIYAFPQGCTEDEYREWVDEMRAIMVSTSI